MIKMSLPRRSLLTVVASAVFGALAAGWFARAFVGEVGGVRRPLDLTLGVVDVVFLLHEVLVLGARLNPRIRIAMWGMMLVANGVAILVDPYRHYVVY